MDSGVVASSAWSCVTCAQGGRRAWRKWREGLRSPPEDLLSREGRVGALAARILPAAPICPRLQMGQRRDPRPTPGAEAILNPINLDMGLHPIQALGQAGLGTQHAPPPLHLLCGVQVLGLCTRSHPVPFLAASVIWPIFICLPWYKTSEKLSCSLGSHSLQ